MWFAVAQAAMQVFGQKRAEEQQKVDDAFRMQMLDISAQQERTNAEAQVAQRMSEYNKVMEAQDIIFGMQGRKEEGSVQAIQQASEKEFERDVSLIRATGQAREQMKRTGMAGEQLARARQTEAQRSQIAANLITSIGKQVQ